MCEKDLYLLCPDQKDILRKVCPRASAPLSELVQAAEDDWGFTGNILLFSMWLCIVCTDEVLSYSVEDLHGRHQDLVKELIKLHRQHGASPHPEVLLKAVLA